MRDKTDKIIDRLLRTKRKRGKLSPMEEGVLEDLQDLKMQERCGTLRVYTLEEYMRHLDEIEDTGDETISATV